MKTIKLAFLGGAALSVLSVGAQADDLADLKAQVEALNARVAQMEAAPQVPAGYSLLTISEAARPETPGLPLTARERAGYGDTATVISVLPTADAPATTTITWSGYARAGLIYSDSDADVTVRGRYYDEEGAGDWEDVYTRELTRIDLDNVIGETEDGQDVYGFAEGTEISLGDYSDISDWEKLGGSYDGDGDWDVKARGQLRVKASTDTAVGEVGVDIRMRGNFDGNGDADAYMDVAWGYWAMTPELTFGGGYAGSLGNVGYGYDGACTCYYTDNADVAFNPGDVSQMRLSYASGPFSMGVAVEDASLNSSRVGDGSNKNTNGDELGVAGEIKYAGDMFSGEISGVWRGVNNDEFPGLDDLWQIGAGVGFSWEMFALSIGAAMGSGPFTVTDSSGVITEAIPYNQDWWGVSALAAFNFNDAWHAEVGVGYKERDGDSFSASGGYFDHGFAIVPLTWGSNGADQETFAVLGGIYYDPVPQLTLGLEAEWYSTDTSFDAVTLDSKGDVADHGIELSVDDEVDNFSVDFVALWRF
jgi:hypothetical protein